MKNRFNIIVLSVMLILSSPLYAQQYSIKAGNLIKAKNGAGGFNIMGYIDSNLVVIEKTTEAAFSSDLKLDYLLYNSELNQIKRTHLKVPKNKQSSKFKYYEIYKYNDKVNVLSSFVNPSKKVSYMFSNSVSNSGVVEKDFKKVNEYSVKSNKHNVIVKHSPDSSKIMILSWDVQQSFKKKKMNCCILDRNFNPIWKKEFILPHKEDDYSFNTYMINNNGKIFIVGELENESRVKGAPKNLLSIISIDSDDDTASVLTLDTKYEVERYITIVDPNNNLHIIASTDEEGDKYTSYIKNIIIDTKTNSILSESTIDIPSYFYDVSRNKTAERNGIINLSLNGIIYANNGEYYILAEQNYTTEKYTTTYPYAMGTRTSVSYFPEGSPMFFINQRLANNYVYKGPGVGNRTYHSNNIYLFHLDINNKLKWATQIAKNQQTFADLGKYNSYYAYIKNNNLYILYNDHIDNPLDNDPYKERKKLKKNTDAKLVITEITPDATITQKEILDLNKSDLVFLPKSASLINQERLFIFGEKKTTNAPANKFKEFSLAEIGLQ